jgi:hypothetical protein
MTSTSATFTHIDLNVEITHLSDLNIDVETSLKNQSIIDLKESNEDNLKDETKDSNNDIDTIFISLCQFTLSLIITRNTFVFFLKNFILLTKGTIDDKSYS